MLSVIGAIAESERALICDRHREGITIAKQRGRLTPARSLHLQIVGFYALKFLATWDSRVPGLGFKPNQPLENWRAH